MLSKKEPAPTPPPQQHEWGLGVSLCSPEPTSNTLVPGAAQAALHSHLPGLPHRSPFRDKNAQRRVGQGGATLEGLRKSEGP